MIKKTKAQQHVKRIKTLFTLNVVSNLKTN